MLVCVLSAEFKQHNFDFKYYATFNKLKHIRNKLDLWKYCILYKYGGIYIDMNFNLSKDFNF